MVQHVTELRAGRPIDAPIYDFARHARQAAMETVVPRRAIIVEGILIFTDAALRKLMDVIVPVGGHNAVAIDMLLTLIRSLTFSSPSSGGSGGRGTPR